jgi:hypothetical protein
VDISLENTLYASCRVRSKKALGSATIISSFDHGDGFETYALTNHHVVEDCIKISKEYDPVVGREVPKEFKAQVEVDFPRFNGDRVVGFSTVLADIVTYDKHQDIALLKFRDAAEYPHANIIPEDKIKEIRFLQNIVVIGNPMGEKLVGTDGRICGMDIEIDNYDYWLGSAMTYFGNCLPGDALVSMANNTVKPIKDIRPGDRVWAYGDRGAGLAQETVTELIEAGEKDIYEIRTQHRTLRASGNHPVVRLQMIKDISGRIRIIPVWIKVEDLQEGDLIAVMKRLPERSRIAGLRLHDYISQRANPHDFYRFLGFYLGDGYKRERPSMGGDVQLYTFDETTWNIYASIVRDLFGVEPHGDKPNRLVIYSVELVRRLEELGFGGDAKTKTIPDWIMTSPVEYQMSFVQGYLDADGYVSKQGAWVFEAASEQLIKRLRMMLIHAGIRVSNIHEREREVDFSRGYTSLSHTWTFQAYPMSPPVNSFATGDWMLVPDDLLFDRVSSIEMVGREMTYDIKLEDRHAFFADGVLVHNSGGGVFTQIGNGAWVYIGIPSRIRVAVLGWSVDIVQHLGYFIPPNRIWKWLHDTCYEYTAAPYKYTKEECDARRQKKVEQEIEKLRQSV